MFVLNKDVAFEACEPGVKRKILAYDKDMMMVEVTFEKGAKGYVHSHPHLQITYVAAGSFEFMVGDEKKLVAKGDSVYIPSNVDHGVEAMEAGMLIDVFNPMRDEFVAGA